MCSVESTDHSKAETAGRVVRLAQVASRKLRKHGVLVCVYGAPDDPLVLAVSAMRLSWHNLRSQ